MGCIVVEGVETSLYGDTQTDGLKEEWGKRDVEEESSEVRKVVSDRTSADNSLALGKHSTSSESPVRVEGGDEKEEVDVEREEEGVLKHSSVLAQEVEEQPSVAPQADTADQTAGMESGSTFTEQGERTCAVVCVEPEPDTGMEWNQDNVQYRLPFEEVSATVSDGVARKTPVDEVAAMDTTPSSPFNATPTAMPTATPITQDKGAHYSSTSVPVVPSSSAAPEHSHESPETSKPAPVTGQPDSAYAHLATGNHGNNENIQATSPCVAPQEAPTHSKLAKWFSLLPRQPCEVTPVPFTNTDSSSTAVAATAQVVASQQVSPTQHQYIMAAPMAAAQYAYVTPSGHVISQPMVQQFGLGYTLVGVPQVGVPQVGVPQVGVPQVGVPQVGVPQVGVPQVGVPQVGVPQAQYVAVNPSQQVQYVVAGQQGMSCVAVAGQQYIALGGNQIVQVAPGVSGGGEVGGSEGGVVVNGEAVTVGVADTSPEAKTMSGDEGEERNTPPPTLSDTRKDTQLVTMEGASQPVATQDGTPLSAPSPVSTVTHEETEERGGEGGGGGGGVGSKLSESEAIQTVVNPAQLHSPQQQQQQQQQQQESEVSALTTHHLHRWVCLRLNLCVYTVSAYLCSTN